MARLITLVAQDGNTRQIEEGKPFRFMPGEKILEDALDRAIIKDDPTEVGLATALHREGIQWGDAVAKLTKVFGIKPCSKCEQRRQILNKAGELGLTETLRQLKETIL